MLGIVLVVIESAAEPPALRTSIHDPGVFGVALIAGHLLVWPIRLKLRLALLPLALLPLTPVWP